MRRQLLTFLLLLTICSSCSSDDPAPHNVRGEYINRTQDEYLFTLAQPERTTPTPYPWEASTPTQHAKITKEFFRCKGSPLNPPRIVQENGEARSYVDCNGSDSHSLPLRNDKEFIYPILIDLLNEVQIKTGKKVIITSGHRCPDHNSYIDSSKGNLYSKHQIGAEASFYVRGLEDKPEQVIALLQKYFREKPRYNDQKEYLEFKRWEKPTDTSTAPWYNKEIFIKLYKSEEGRNLDNRHPYPYISLQVRYDVDTSEKVQYSWDKAYRNYMRW